MQYFLDVLGQRFGLSVPFELHISPNMIPFLQPAKKDDSCSHIIVQEGMIPLPEHDWIWREAGYYECGTDGLCLVRCHSRGAAPYVMVEQHHDGNVLVTYRSNYLHMLENASDLLQMIGLERLLLQHGGLILHASFVAKDGKGILFSAPSGTGKSTQASLWQAYRGYEILNGDRAGLRLSDGHLYGWGLPYAGSSGIYRNQSAMIGAIIILRQGSENKLTRLQTASAVRYLYPETTIHHWAEQFVNRALDLLQIMVESTPVFLLECLPNEDAVKLLEQMLQKEGII